MKRQKFRSRPIFFDEPFIRGLIVIGTHSLAEYASYLYMKCIFTRRVYGHYSFEIRVLVTTDFLGYFIICINIIRKNRNRIYIVIMKTEKNYIML